MVSKCFDYRNSLEIKFYFNRTFYARCQAMPAFATYTVQVYLDYAECYVDWHGYTQI